MREGGFVGVFSVVNENNRRRWCGWFVGYVFGNIWLFFGNFYVWWGCFCYCFWSCYFCCLNFSYGILSFVGEVLRIWGFIGIFGSVVVGYVEENISMIYVWDLSVKILVCLFYLKDEVFGEEIY